jgi:hypothetical protein
MLRHAANRERVLLRENDAAAAIVRVLDLHQGGRRIEHVAARLEGVCQIQGREQTTPTHDGELHAGVGGGGAGFVPDGVALVADDDVVAGLRQRAQRHLVRHRAARQPDGSFFV